MSVPISFRISDELAERLEKIAYQMHDPRKGKFNRSESLILAIEEFCDNHEDAEYSEYNLAKNIRDMIRNEIFLMEEKLDAILDQKIKDQLENTLNSENTNTEDNEDIEYTDKHQWTDKEVAEEENKKPDTVRKYRTGSSKIPQAFAKRWRVSHSNSKRWEFIN